MVPAACEDSCGGAQPILPRLLSGRTSAYIRVRSTLRCKAPAWAPSFEFSVTGWPTA